MPQLIPGVWLLLGILLGYQLNGVVPGQNVAIATSAPKSRPVNVRIESSVHSEMERFALGELRESLGAARYSVNGQGKQDVTVKLRTSPGAPQSYSIQRDATTITVTGGDDRGLMYGILRLAEEVKLGEPLERVSDESQKPFVGIRAFKFNLPLPGTLYLSPSALTNNQWFWSLDYWTKFLNALAEDRYNALEFWSAEPWGQMVSLTQYPEATSLTPAEMQRHIQFFSKLFHMAKVRGIDTYLVTWNIVLDSAFARAHHLPERNVDTPLARTYLRDCIRTTLVTYPGLAGLGTTQGEDMDVIPETQRGNWISDVYFRAIRESGRRNVPFILRYWGGTPEDTERAAAEYTLGPVYLDIKYNGEHVYSSPMYHVENSAWLTQKHNYQLLWHLRNDDLFTFRWGNPQFVGQLMRNMGRTSPAGFTYGSEEDIPGPENFDTPAARANQAWPYEFQKQWFMFALWGRLGYNPELSDQLWRKYFGYEYGSAGKALYACTVAAGRIAPLITSFHWNYMNGDWMPEGSIGSWNTSYEQPRINYRRFEMYHNILDYVFNNTIDGNYENIPQYAAQALAGAHPLVNAASPIDVANDLEQDGYKALAAARIPPPGRKFSHRFKAAQSDDEAYGRLALYYAEKLRGATDLGLYILGGPPAKRESAVTHLKNSLSEWRQLVANTQAHYLPREIWQMGVFHWSMYTSAVEHDIAIAESLNPVAATSEKWEVASALTRAPAWKTVTLRELRPFGAAGLSGWRLYSNTLFNAPIVQATAGRRSSYLWRRELPPSGTRRWVLAIPGNAQAQVSFTSSNISSPTRIAKLSVPQVGYSVYLLGKSGLVEATLPAGIVPEATTIARAGNPIRLSIPAARAMPPLVQTADGALELPHGSALDVSVPSEVLPEVNLAGSVLFDVSIRDDGFYRIRCEFRNGTSASFAVDQYNGVHNSIDTEDAAGNPAEISSPHGWARASSVWPVPLGSGEHTLRIYLRHPGERMKNVEITPVTPN